MKEKHMLYLVSTPIGNLGDMSDRAKSTLSSVDMIACEDTRTTKQLLTLLGIKSPKLVAYHDYNEDKAKESLIALLQQGKNIALVSDAGSPLISDPGYKLVAACHEHNIAVTSVPGANAILPALQLSGLPSNAFCFGGFLPPKSSARQKHLQSFLQTPCTLIFYETPNRLLGALSDVQKIFNDPIVATVREITKKFEETRRGTTAALIEYYARNGLPKGELVLVIDHKITPEILSDDEITDRLKRLLETHSVKEAAKILHDETGLPKKDLYTRALDLK